MRTIVINHRSYEYCWTDERIPKFEIFAPDGYVFFPDNVTSFVCVDRKDAIERVQASELELEETE